MAGKPLLQQMGRSGGGKCIVWALQRENRWGRAPVVGPTGHLNGQIAHLHLRLRTGDITSQRFVQSSMHRCSQHIYSLAQWQQIAVSALPIHQWKHETNQNWKGSIRFVMILIITYKPHNSKLS